MGFMKTAAALILVSACIFSGVVIALENPAKAPDSPSQATPSEEAKVYRIGHGVKPPRVIEMPGPKLTEEERKNGKRKYAGVALLSLIVTTDGKPYNIKVMKSLRPDLDKRAIEAVKTWKFDPATKDGKPVMVEISVEVTFHLDK